MWLSERRNNPGWTDGTAQVGRVTLPGDPAGVYLAGERRDLPVFGPGGYFWRPDTEQKVLVIKMGADGEQPCVAGTRTEDEGPELEPGEIYIRAGSGGTSIKLDNHGNLYLNGEVYLNGIPLTALLGGMGG